MRQKGLKFRPGENAYIGRDQTIHASKEGKVVFEKNHWLERKRWKIHVVQQENPNRVLPNPPPFMYHPELYPELAKRNPQPYNLVLPKSKPPKKKNPSRLGLRLAEDNEVGGIYGL